MEAFDQRVGQIAYAEEDLAVAYHSEHNPEEQGSPQEGLPDQERPEEDNPSEADTPGELGGLGQGLAELEQERDVGVQAVAVAVLVPMDLVDEGSVQAQLQVLVLDHAMSPAQGDS